MAQGQIEPLTDDELQAIAHDPQLITRLTSEERRRLASLAPTRMGPNPPGGRLRDLVAGVGGQMRAAGADPSASMGSGGMVPMGEPSGIEQFLQTPLGRPTGIGLIDDLTSPANLALGGMGLTSAALRARNSLGGIFDLLRRGAAKADPADLAGVVSPRAGHAVKIGRAIRDAAREAPAEAPATPARPPVAAGKSEKFAETTQGADQLDELLQKIHGEDYPSQPNGGPGTPRTTPPTPSTEAPTRAAARARPSSPATPASRRSRAASPTTPITSFEDLTDLEKIQGEQLLRQGKTPPEILDHLNAMREFRAKFNTMSPEEGERAAARNRTQSKKEHAKKRAERDAGGSDDD
jgi:hypothetical protein